MWVQPVFILLTYKQTNNGVWKCTSSQLKLWSRTIHCIRDVHWRDISVQGKGYLCWVWIFIQRTLLILKTWLTPKSVYPNPESKRQGKSSFSSRVTNMHVSGVVTVWHFEINQFVQTRTFIFFFEPFCQSICLHEHTFTWDFKPVTSFLGMMALPFASL